MRSLSLQSSHAVRSGPTCFPHTNGVFLQRKCNCGQHSGPGEECEACKNKQMHRKESAAAGPAVAPPIVHDVLSSSGRPLDAPTRSFFEPRFGYDFSRVRIHTDEQAAASARAVNALAYTVGHQLVFESGRFDPRSVSGQSLIAHELAHVMQQSGQRASHSDLMVTGAHDAFEYDADRVAQKVLAGGEAEPAARKHGAAVQRQQPPGSPGPPAMGGPDWGVTCDFSKFPPECSANTPAGDVEREQVRCYVLAKEGRCPPECEDTLRKIGVPCVRPQAPGPLPPTGGGPILPKCPPGEISISGKCVPFRRPDSTPPPPTGGPASPKCPPDQIPTITGRCAPTRLPPTTVPPGPRTGVPTAPRLGHGTIESETLDNFALNDPQVPPQYVGQLDHLAGLLNVYREVEVHIEGHTDGSGTEAINIPLSRQRAEAVKAQLIRRHVVNPARLKTSGFSSHQPLVTPQEPTAKEPKNRRVEVWYYIPPSKPMGEGLRLDTKP